jgi:hypothetical protein
MLDSLFFAVQHNASDQFETARLAHAALQVFQM